MKKGYLYLLSILTGILLWLSWTPKGFPFLIFFAWVPLFFISEDLLKKEVKHPFWSGVWFSFISFLIWNVATTWWIWNATPEGSIAAFVLNSFFMSLVFGCWQGFRSMKLHPVSDAVTFISFWSSWEFLHLNWDITWPWLNLGNVFASCTEYVQWYEYTGTFGGLIWILIANFLIFYLLRDIILLREEKNNRKRIILGTILTCWIALPMVGSIVRYQTYQLPKDETDKPIEAVIVQQNTEPHEEQYEMSNLEHTQRILSVAEPAITPNTRIVVCAETAIPWSVLTDPIIAKDYPSFNDSYSGFLLFDTLVNKHNDLNLIIGLSTVKFFDHKASPTCQERGESGLFMESYNTSVCYNRHGLSQMYYKSKLVPAVEKMPYPQVFGFLEKLAIDLGGTSGSLGIDSVQRTFTLDGVPFKVGVPICYESAYGEHFGKFIKNGAQLMAVITNDGWWKDTPGYQQHFLFSKLRAVETRRTIMRSANTGISAFIDERGDAHQQTHYNTRLAIRQNVYPNQTITFYVQHGDYIARILLLFAAFSAIWGIFIYIKRRIRH